MKTTPTLLLLAAWLASLNFHAAEAPTNGPAPAALAPPAPPTPPAPAPAVDPTGAPIPPAADATHVPNGQAPTPPPADGTVPAEATVTNVPSPTVILPNGEVGLRLNFRGVPLELVLNTLSDAAGFIIVLDTQVRGKVDVWSNTPLTKDEAVNLLNSVLNKNGYAAIRNGRTLTIVNKDEAKTRDIPVKQGSDPANIPRNDEIVTQILPMRFVEAAQLIKDLQPLVSSTTTMTANEAGNSIVITDTQANIRRVAEIIKAIDTGAEDETQVRVFTLKYADPVEMATLLGSLFPDSGSGRSGDSQAPVRFGGMRSMFGGGGSPFGGGGGGSSSGAAASRIKKGNRVVAVADARTSSVVVSARKEMVEQIAGMIEQLDANPAKKQKVYVYSLDNADATEVQQVLQDMFGGTTTSSSRNSQNQNNALQNRTTQNNQQSRSGTGSSPFGGSSSRGGGGGGF